MSHLHKYLEDNAILYPEQLQEALRRQEIYGGSLDTALLELGLIDPVTLNDLLVNACGIPVAPVELIDNGHDRPWDALPAPMMAVGWAQPLVRRGDDILVAVHPDLPDDQLGALYRKVPGVKVHVSPECCLQKISAERLGAIMPQRYAVTCVQYLSAIKRRPSVSGVYDLPPQEVTPSYSGPIAERAATLAPLQDNPLARADHSHTIAGVNVVETSASPPNESAASAETVADATYPRDDTGPHRTHSTELDADDGPTSVFSAYADPADSGVAALDPVEGVELGDYGPADEGEAEDDSAAAPEVLDDSPAERTAPRTVESDAVPEPVESTDAAPLGRRTRSGTQIYEQPPVRYTGRGTMIGEPVAFDEMFDEADLIRRVATARFALENADNRDDAIRGIVTAGTVIAPRIGLFRVRGAELVGLSTPGSAIDDLGGKVVPATPGTAAGDVVAVGRWMGMPRAPELLLAVGTAQPHHAVLRRIDVRGRPVLVLYADHAGREFLPAETAQLDELCAAASNAFEAILRARRTARGSAEARPATPEPEPTAAAAPEPAAAAAPEPGPSPAPSPAPDASSSAPLDVGPHGQWGPPSDNLVRAYGSVSGSTAADEGVEARAELEVELELPASITAPPPAEPETIDEAPEPPRRNTEELAPGLDRVATPDDPTPPPTAQSTEELSNLKLTWVSSPPPPPLPPPPPPDVDVDQDELVGTRRRNPTLHGLPPLDPDEIEDSASEIISLSTPLAQTSVRGRIALEDEDWVGNEEPEQEPSLASHIDQIIEAIIGGEDRLAELHDIGPLAWQRLAARFPGPIEVLRRDLRALPPPAAHGPLMRTAIAAGHSAVPALLDLFEHPNPDVRFYAAFLFQELRDARCAEPLARLAFDPNGDVRVIAMRVLETYSRTAAFRSATDAVRSQLSEGGRAEQLYAARAVGTLRDVEAIPRLIEMLSAKDRFIQEAALESLCSITGQQHGLKPHRWRSWYDEHADKHRIEWIIDSLLHRDLPVRRWAADELIRVTGHRIPFSPMGDRRSRELAAQAWIDWWNDRGRRQLTAVHAADAPPP